MVILRCDPPAAPLSYSFVPRSSAEPLSLAIDGAEPVGAVKMRLLSAVLPSSIVLSFWGRDLLDADDILSYGIPGGTAIALDLRVIKSIAVELNGVTTDFSFGSPSTGEGDRICRMSQP
jgi:hypothetical protein